MSLFILKIIPLHFSSLLWLLAMVSQYLETADREFMPEPEAK